MDAAGTNTVAVPVPQGRTPRDGWLGESEQDIELAGLVARLNRWVVRYDAVLDGDHEVKMANAPIPAGSPAIPNPWPGRLKLLASAGERLTRELARYEAVGTGVGGAAEFREAYSEAVAEIEAAEDLAARPPLDIAKLMARIVPPSKEWFDREHQLDAEGREW